MTRGIFFSEKTENRKGLFRPRFQLRFASKIILIEKPT